MSEPATVMTARAFMTSQIGIGHASGLALVSPNVLNGEAAIYDRPCETDILLVRTSAGVVASVPELKAAQDRMKRYDECAQISGNRPGWSAQISRFLQEIASEPRLMTVR